jgi:hypothetical protein
VTVTEEFAVDLGSGLRRGELTVCCFPPITDVFQLKLPGILGRSAVLVCECGMIQLFYVAFHVIRALHNLTPGLLVTKKVTNDDQCKDTH